VSDLAYYDLERVGRQTIPIDSPRQFAQLEDVPYADAETHVLPGGVRTLRVAHQHCERITRIESYKAAGLERGLERDYLIGSKACSPRRTS
jgi:hypothetical protein